MLPLRSFFSVELSSLCPPPPPPSPPILFFSSPFSSSSRQPNGFRRHPSDVQRASSSSSAVPSSPILSLSLLYMPKKVLSLSLLLLPFLLQSCRDIGEDRTFIGVQKNRQSFVGWKKKTQLGGRHPEFVLVVVLLVHTYIPTYTGVGAERKQMVFLLLLPPMGVDP